jgi:hypothetical protein
MRLKPALIMLAVFVLVVGGLAWFVATYEAPEGTATGAHEPRLLLGVAPDAIRRIDFVSPKAGSPVVLERRDGLWRMVSPVETLADGQKADALADALARLESAFGFATRSFIEYELDEPKYRVSISAATPEGGTVTRTLTFGTEMAGVARAGGKTYTDFYTLDEVGGSQKTVPHRYVRVDARDEVVLAADVVCPLLDVPAAAFREPRLVYARTPGGVAAIKPDEVAALTIRPHGRTPVELVAGDRGAWRVTEPVADRASVAKVRGVLERALALRAETPGDFVADRPDDLANYGLEPPVVEIELRTRAGEGAGAPMHVVRFGTQPPGDAERVFAWSSTAKRVLRVRNEVVARLLEPPDRFRDRRLVMLDADEVAMLALAYGGGRKPLQLVRRDDDARRWSIRRPVQGRADTEAANSLLKRIVGLEAAGFVDEPGELAQYGLGKPELTISLVRKGETDPDARVLISRHSPPGRAHLLYARAAGDATVTTVLKEVADSFWPEVADLRSRTVWEGFDRWGAIEIAATHDGRTVRLRKRDAGGWAFVEPKGVPVHFTAPADFLATVADLRIADWPADRPDDLKPFGLDPPQAALVVRVRPETLDEYGRRIPTDEEPVTYTLHLGNRTDDGTHAFARVPPEPSVYTVAADLLRRIEKGPLEFRHRLMLAFDPNRVESVRIEGGRAEYAAQQAPRREPGPNTPWLLASPFLGEASRPDLKKLFEQLRTVVAKELIAKDGVDDPAYGLRPKGGRRYRAVSLTYAELVRRPRENATGPGDAPPETREVTRTLIIGNPAPGSENDRYAVIAEHGTVFVMAGDEVAKLDREYASRRILNLIPATVAEIGVAHRTGNRVAANRTPEGWELTSHPGTDADRRKVDRLAAAASQVRCEGFVRYSVHDLSAARKKAFGLDRPALTVTVRPQGKLAFTLQIGGRAAKLPDWVDAGAGEVYYATGGGVPAVYLLSEETVKSLSVNVEDVMRVGGEE